MLVTWHSKDTEIKTENSLVNTLVQDGSNADADTEQRPTVTGEAVSLFDTIDNALINVRTQAYSGTSFKGQSE